MDEGGGREGGRDDDEDDGCWSHWSENSLPSLRPSPFLLSMGSWLDGVKNSARGRGRESRAGGKSSLLSFLAFVRQGWGGGPLPPLHRRKSIPRLSRKWMQQTPPISFLSMDTSAPTEGREAGWESDVSVLSQMGLRFSFLFLLLLHPAHPPTFTAALQPPAERGGRAN